MNVVQYEPELESFDDVESPELLIDAREQSESKTGHAAFDLFLLINATLFIRPSESIPALDGWPIYELLNLICIALCFPQMMSKLSRVMGRSWSGWRTRNTGAGRTLA